MTDETPGRRDYHGKSWLAKNTHHVGTLLVIVFCFSVYFVLPVLGLPVPSVPETVFLTLGTVIGVRMWKSGSADVEANKR